MLSLTLPDNFIPKFEVVGCLFEFEGEILLLKRQDHKLQPDSYGMPAGKMDGGERPSEALSREIFEETGLSIDESSLKFIQSYYVVDSNHSFIFHLFSKSFQDRPIILINREEHKSYAWSTPKDSLKLDLIEDLHEVLVSHYNI